MVEILVRKRQLTLKSETVKGTYETGLDTDSTAKATADFNLVDPTWTPNSTNFARDIRTSTLALFPNTFPGVTSADLTFGVELAGEKDNVSGTDFVEPPLARLLTFAGFDSVAVQGATVTAVTGEFRHGETLTFGGTGTGTCVGGYRDSFHAKLYWKLDSGTTTGTITGDVSGATATLGVKDTYTTWSCSPLSDAANIPTASGIYYVDGKRAKVKAGRGDVSFTFTHADRVVATMTLQTILEAYIDGALLSGANAPIVQQAKPPANLGTGFKFHDGTASYAPCYNTLEIGMNNTVALRECTTEDDGWDVATIGGRTPGGSINVDEVLNTTFDYVAAYEAGTTLDTVFSIGSTVGNVMEFRAPALQISNLSEGDRDGTTIFDMQFNLTAGQFSDGTFGADNELTLLFI